MNLQALAPKRIWPLLRDTATDWMEDNALRLSAALAYYSVFSIAPLLVIAIGIAGLAFGAEAVQGQVDDQLKGTIGAEAASTVQSMIKSASKGGGAASVVGIVLLLVGASGVFAALKDALNTIWEVKAKPGLGIKGFIKDRVLSFGMVLVIGFLLLVSLMLTTALAAMNKFFGDALGIPAGIWAVVGFVVSFAVVTALFATIFKVLPDVKVSWRHVWIGAAVTAFLFEIGKFLLGWYLGREGAESTYGTATSVVLLLLWVYYTSLILLFGAEFTQVYARSSGAVVEPADNAVPVTEEKRAQEGLEPATSGAAIPAGPSGNGNGSPSREMPRVILGIPPQEEGPNPMPGLLIATSVGVGLGLLSRWRERTAQAPIEKIQDGVSELASLGGDALGGLWDKAASQGRKVFGRS